MGTFHLCQTLSVLNVRMSESEYKCLLERQNQNTITESNIIGFSKLGHLQIFLFFIFLLGYLTILMANATIMTVIHLNWALHTSRYFFLFGLSCFEICYTFVIVPKCWPRAFHKSDYLFLWVCFPALFLCGLGLNQLFPNCCDELWLLCCHLQPFQLYTHCQLSHLHTVGFSLRLLWFPDLCGCQRPGV